MQHETIDIEKIVLLAENYVNAKKEANENLKLIKEELKDVDIEISRTLSTGGKISYVLYQPANSFDYRGYGNFLHQSMLEGRTFTPEELEDLIKEYVVAKEPKWKLKITTK
ncbi:hypothetical protein NPA13_01425 [Mycoplasma sp. 2045]|uniref:hypothetical protein n=1 Tax=unclassified Mycoplasma TaxID=2683645 RepID=UPI00211CD3B8|nr:MULTISPECIES: hypothetical protein [unclassified Mycoplasma]MEA4162600.1 hypothetical protein [Mycoplasma sp. 4404]MEA4190900.1 hypothetical protein [Mycoplasma sp. 2248]MEA4276079.1 hypothetical protein [Mycoplasma sp. 21DD0573]UUM20657.1 hypothetical protein NPA13_01425 [Mycoplasma sp. 2045]